MIGELCVAAVALSFAADHLIDTARDLGRALARAVR